MKTKIIPFDLETAKKIQAGEVKGAIKTSSGRNARILCDDVQGAYPLAVAVTIGPGEEELFRHRLNGDGLLFLEVPDNEPQFKPFQEVLVRDADKSEWRPRLYSRKGNIGYCTQDGCEYMQCIPYEGNESLVGTTYKPKEE